MNLVTDGVKYPMPIPTAIAAKITTVKNLSKRDSVFWAPIVTWLLLGCFHTNQQCGALKVKTELGKISFQLGLLLGIQLGAIFGTLYSFGYSQSKHRACRLATFSAIGPWQ